MTGDSVGLQWQQAIWTRNHARAKSMHEEH